MNKRLEHKEYPNRKQLRSMYERRINRKLTYDQFRSAVKRDIDLNNQKYEVEKTMNEQMNKNSTEGSGQ